MAELLFFTPTLEELEGTYNELSPYLYSDAMAHSVLANAQFGERLVSCFDQRGAVEAREQRCWWLRLASRDLQRDATAANLDYENQGIELSGGIEYRLDGDRSFGWGLSYLQAESISNGRGSTDSDLYQIGALYKHPLGKFIFSGSAIAGLGRFESTRLIEIPTLVSEIVEASPRHTFYALRGGLSREMLREKWYLRGALDVGLNYLKVSSFSENGESIAALDMASLSDTFVSVYPSLEIGGRMQPFGQTASVRPFARIGYMGLGVGGAPELEASFAGTPDGVMPFTFESGLERDYAQLAIGLDFLGSKQNVIRLEANGIKGSATTQYGIEGSWSLFFK